MNVAGHDFPLEFRRLSRCASALLRLAIWAAWFGPTAASTVVWNPWIAKARQMPDFGDEEYERMLCVESGNVASNSISLPPGGSSTLTVKLSSETLK